MAAATDLAPTERFGPPALPQIHLEPPSRQYILHSLRELERLYDADDKQIKRLRSVREQKNRVVLPDKHRLVSVEIRDPTVSDECQRTTATLSVNPPKWTITGKPSLDAQDNATLREHWTEAVLTEAGSKEPGMPTFQRIVDAVVADGGGWSKLLFDRDVWEYRYSIDHMSRKYTSYEDPPPNTPDDLLDEVDDEDGEETNDDAMAEMPGDGAGGGQADDVVGSTAQKGIERTEVMVGRGRNRKKKLRVTDWKSYNADTEDAKREAGVPFTWTAIDALTVYPVFRGRRVAEVIEVSERPLLSTFRQYRLTREADGTLRKLRPGEPFPDEMLERQAQNTVKSVQTCRFIEHWDDTYCFPAGTLVNSDNDLVGASKRWYKGNLVKIRTAGGHELTGTPNHAVLTQRGWVALGKIKKGDCVVRRTLGEGVVPVDPDEQNADVPIEQVFDLVAVTGARERRSGSEKDFHGDGQDGEVDVVAANRHLRNRVQSPVTQPTLERFFTPTPQSEGSLVATHDGLRVSDALPAALHAGVGGQDVGRPLFRREGGLPESRSVTGITRGGLSADEASGNHDYRTPVTASQGSRGFTGEVAPGNIRVIDAEALPAFISEPPPCGGTDNLASGPHGNARCLEAGSRSPLTDAVSCGNGSQGLAAYGVTLDDVVDIQISVFEGHVYNLETSNHWYYANGILVHNCTYLVIGGKGTGFGLYDLGNAVAVQQFVHGYGRAPFFWSPGLWMNHWRNKKVGWGVSQSKLWLVEYRSFLLTIHAQVVARDAFPPLFRTTPIQDAQAAQLIGNAQTPKKDAQWALAEVIEGRPGEELKPIQFPNVGQALREEIQLITEMIEKLEAPRVSSQIGSNVEGAGFAINQLLSEAKLRFDPIAQSVSRCLEEITRFLWEMVRTVCKEVVWVYKAKGSNTGWKAAGPKDLAPGVAVTVDLDPERPSAKLIEERYWHERLKAGTASLDQAITAMGDNPDEVRIGRALDAVRASPLYQAWIVNEVLSMAGRGDLIKKTKAAEKMADTGAIPPPGGASGGMGGQNGPVDMGTLAASPNGAGAAPATPVQVGIGAPNGSVPGGGPGVVVPEQAAAAGMQPLRTGA